MTEITYILLAVIVLVVLIDLYLKKKKESAGNKDVEKVFEKEIKDSFIKKGNLRLLISINIIISLFLMFVWRPDIYGFYYSFSFPVVFSIGYWLVLLIIREMKIVNNQINPDLLKLIIKKLV